MKLKVDRKPVDVEVLIAGGGIAGLMAGIRAAEQGVSVMVVEKANTKRSGSGATGNDHFCCYIPEVHGKDMEPILWEDLHSLHGDFQDPSLAKLFLEKTFDRVRDWDTSMRPRGFWDFTGHAYPGRPRIFLKYAGYNQKEVLTREAKKRGVKLMNHHVVSDVIVSKGRVIGAVAIGTEGEAPELKVLRTKSVVLATGAATRLYPSSTPGHRLPGRRQTDQHGNPQPACGSEISCPLREGDLDRGLQGPSRPSRGALCDAAHPGTG